MTVTGSPRCWPNSPEAMPALSPSLRASCSRCGPLRGSGVDLVGLVAVGLVAAGAHGGVDRLQIGAGFGVDPARQPAHAVGALGAQVQTAAAGAVVLVEQPVGVEVIGDSAPDHGDERGVLTNRVAHQDSFGLIPLVAGHRRGQHIERVADRADVLLADVTVLHGGGEVGQLGRQRGSGQRTARADSRSDAQPAPHFAGVIRSRCHSSLAITVPAGRSGSSGPSGRFDEFAEEPVHQPAVDPVLSFQPLATSTRKALPTESEHVTRSRA